MLCPGDRVKDYEIVTPLRSGGMGMLYLARRRGVGGFARLVALKVVHPQLLGEQRVSQSLLDEARISAQIAHPNVVKVEEAGKIDDLQFIAMEYVQGVSLAELLDVLAERGQRMSPKLCVWLAAQVAEGLRAIHAAAGEDGTPMHIVHRDVSPQNVLVSRTGHIKLIDFGIADSQQTQVRQSGRRTLLGKLGYMAPEQLHLEQVDRRCDVYALGVMLWEMLTARRFLRCERIDDERDWELRRAPPPPSTYSARIMPALDRAVLKAMAYEPEHRFGGALTFRAALLEAVPTAGRLDAPTLEALLRALCEGRWQPRHETLAAGAGGEPDDEDEVTHLLPPQHVRDLTSAARDLAAHASLDEMQDEPKTLAATPSALRVALAISAAEEERNPALIETDHPTTLRRLSRDSSRRAVRAARALGLPVFSLLCGAALGSLAVQRDTCVLPALARRGAARQPPAAQHGSVVLPELRVQAGADAGHEEPAHGAAPRPELLAAPHVRLESAPNARLGPARAGNAD